MNERNAVFAADLGTTISLDRLHIGGSAIVRTVTGEMRLRRRLLEMGLCPGVRVSAVRRAPLGDPIEFQVRGYLLSLRADQAALVVVSP